VAKKKRKGRRRGRGGFRIASGKDKAYIVAGSALYGYMSHHVDFFETLPVVTTIGAPLTHGILLHFAAGAASGELRKWLDLSSVGALAVGGYHLGITKGDLEAAAAMKGDEDDPFADDEESIELRGHGDDVDYLEGDTDDFDDDDDDDDDLEGDRDDFDDDDIDDEYYDEAAA